MDVDLLLVLLFLVVIILPISLLSLLLIRIGGNQQQLNQLTDLLHELKKEIQQLRNNSDNLQAPFSQDENEDEKETASEPSAPNESIPTIQFADLTSPTYTTHIDHTHTDNASSQEAQLKTAQIEPEIKVTTYTDNQEASISIDSISLKTNKEALNEKTLWKRLETLLKRMTDNWMTWVGAITLSIGGFFFTRYLIELGVFPPWLRLIIGCIFGALLVAAAYWLDKKGITFEKSTNYTPAAIASAGIITCFSMVYMAYFKYDFLNTYLTFGLLSLVCLIGGLLALRLGPILAAVGFVGAYSIPALVSSGSHQFWGLYAYLGLISLFTTYITNQLNIKWLWRFIYVGHFGWYWIGIGFLLVQASPEQFMPQLNAVCAYAALSFIGFVYYPTFGMSVKTVSTRVYLLSALIKPTRSNLLMCTIFIPVLIYTSQQAILYHAFPLSLFALLIFFMAALLLMPLKNSRWDAWMLLPLGTIIILILFKMISNEWQDGAVETLFSWTGIFIFEQVMTVILFVYGLWFSQRYAQRYAFHWLALLSSITVVGLYITYLYHEPVSSAVEIITERNLYTYWCSVLLLSAIGLGYSTHKYPHAYFSPLFWSVANINVLLAIFLWFNGHIASLFIALQILILSQLHSRQHCQFPAIIIKVLMSLLLLRLTVSPWIPSSYYQMELFDFHATLIVYPISLFLLLLARQCWQKAQPLKVWFEGGILHLVALFITTETSYQLLGRYPSLIDGNFYESVLLCFNWLLLTSAYLYRSIGAQGLQTFYQKSIVILLVGAAYFHIRMLLMTDPFIHSISLGTLPIVNWSLLAWLLPALILSGIIIYHRKLNMTFFPSRVIQAGWVIIGLALFIFINVEIRHYYQGFLTGAGTLQGQITNGEMYTYSIVWLIISAGLVVFASTQKHAILQRIGLALIALVVLKVFLIDMSNLTGLLRALSFIGLGGSLIGLGWLFQKLRQSDNKSTS